MALPLIDKLDTVELVRNQIAGILAAEVVAQKALAVLAAKDPLDWHLNIQIERDQPLEPWLNAGPVITEETAPYVNVWWESSSIDLAMTSNPKAEQIFGVTYNLDVTARGFNSDDPGGGHIPADRDARLRCAGAVRLVRNILSATENMRLQLPASGPVHAFPQFENMELGPATSDETEPNFSAWGCRCRFRVKMTEFSPEFTDFGTIETIRIDVSDDGGVILSTEITA